MKILRPKNTKKAGFVEFFVYPEKDKFVGICLTFDIIEEGQDVNELMRDLKKAALLYLKVVINKKLSEDLLNRYAPKGYWEKYFNFLKNLEEAKVANKRKMATSLFPYDSQSLNRELSLARS